MIEFIITTGVISAIAYGIIQYKDRKKLKTKISFKESMDLTELPIVTFYNNGKKLNFLLDTGSNLSYINKSMLDNIDYVEGDEVTTMFGIEGNVIEIPVCVMDIEYKGQRFNTQFSVNDMDAAFDNIKQESGVQIHGILGSLFFQKYKYVLDFEELIAYNK